MKHFRMKLKGGSDDLLICAAMVCFKTYVRSKLELQHELNCQVVIEADPLVKWICIQD